MILILRLSNPKTSHVKFYFLSLLCFFLALFEHLSKRREKREKIKTQVSTLFNVQTCW